MKNGNYNGYSNRETWCCTQWLQSTYEIYQDLQGFKQVCNDREVFGRHIVGKIIKHCADQDGNYLKMIKDIGDIDQVDFFEVADAILAE